VEVEVSDAAVMWLISRGSSLYLWHEPVGAWVTDHVSTEHPGPGLEFDTFFIEETPIRLHLERSLPQPADLTIDTRRWPFRGLRIYWDGNRWGWRGPGDGGGGG
jgi:hypothetical protein